MTKVYLLKHIKILNTKHITLKTQEGRGLSMFYGHLLLRQRRNLTVGHGKRDLSVESLNVVTSVIYITVRTSKSVVSFSTLKSAQQMPGLTATPCSRATRRWDTPQTALPGWISGHLAGFCLGKSYYSNKPPKLAPIRWCQYFGLYRQVISGPICPWVQNH